MRKPFFCTLIGILVIVSVSHAEDQLKVGMNAPTSIVAEFVTGEWAERGSSCPILLRHDSTKVAIFVKHLNDPVLPLVGAIEEMVTDDSSLKWSFVFVSHENAPTPNQQEWDAQIAQLKKLSSDQKIEHLSLGVMLRIPENGKPSRAKRKLGFFGEDDVVVMLIRPDATAQRGVIQYLSSLKSKEIDSKTIERIRNEINDALIRSKD